MVDNFSIFIFWVDCISRLKSKSTLSCFKEKNSLLGAKIFPQTLLLLTNKKNSKAFWNTRSSTGHSSWVYHILHCWIVLGYTAELSCECTLRSSWMALFFNKLLTFMLGRPKGWVTVPTCALFHFFPLLLFS